MELLEKDMKALAKEEGIVRWVGLIVSFVVELFESFFVVVRGLLNNPLSAFVVMVTSSFCGVREVEQIRVTQGHVRLPLRICRKSGLQGVGVSTIEPKRSSWRDGCWLQAN